MLYNRLENRQLKQLQLLPFSSFVLFIDIIIILHHYIVQ